MTPHIMFLIIRSNIALNPRYNDIPSVPQPDFSDRVTHQSQREELHRRPHVPPLALSLVNGRAP